MRFFYILAHRRTKRWFERLGYDPSEEDFKFRRGQYFWHTRAAIGHATALAVARRARIAEHTLRRNRAGLHTQDDGYRRSVKKAKKMTALCAEIASRAGTAQEISAACGTGLRN